ncbi:MAG: ABC transporter substrate-binding protein [Alphaproteobacteria bacterium]|nr:ABC transporter substrate-binding protein [Alphaproteobacteria bacterium]
MRRLAVAVLIAGAMSGAADAQVKDLLTIDLPNDAATLDPHLQSDTDSVAVYRNVFDSLIASEGGKMTPRLATGWRYTDDTTLVFDLRTDATWHDGSKVTAEDVVFSIRRITDPKTRSSQLSQLDQIIAAEVTGPAQVTLRTKTPFPPLLVQIGNISIVPKAVIEKLGDAGFNQAPVGSGPYRVRSWQRGVQSVLDANPAYWRGAAPFRQVNFRAVPDSATRVADLRAGRADINRQMSADDAQNVKGDPALQVLATPTERIGYLFVNALWGPTKDLRVRQAVAMAIDRDAIVKTLLEGYARPVNVMLTPVSFGYTPDVKTWPFDPARARALVKEAGAEGATLRFLNSPAYNRGITEAIQQMLTDVGLKVEIAEMDMASYLRNRQGAPGDAGSIAQGRWSCGCQDADGTIFPLFRTGSPWAKYSNPELDSTMDAARSTLDAAKRLALYRRAFEIIREEVPAVPLYQDFAIYGARKELRWVPQPNEAFLVFDMRWQN